MVETGIVKIVSVRVYKGGNVYGIATVCAGGDFARI